MKALVVKVEYASDDDEAKEPVVTVQVADNLVGRIADEDNEIPQGAHLKPPPPCPQPPPQANAPVGEARPIIADATMEMI
jgi:hypothetical protein